nr:NAD(P)/FAD-dependent oxidoreductase [Methanothermus fervidus]
MKTDVVIIGAGPAGLLAANELSDYFNVIVIDKGKDIDKRVCLALKDGKCRRCSPCNIMSGMGGAGGLSDGKLNLDPNIGGNLTEFVSKKEAMELIREVDEFFVKHGAPKKLYIPNEDKALEISKKAAAHGIKFIPIVQRHIGSDRTQKVIKSIKNDLESRGVKFILETEVLKIICDKNKVKGVLVRKGNKKFEIECKYLIAAPGRGGMRWFSKELKNLGIPVKHNPVDIGVRVEVPHIVMDPVTSVTWDPKFHIITKTYDDFVRTFCVCNRGFVVEEVYDNFIGVNGHSMQHKKSENTNFAFLVNVKLTEPIENTSAYASSIARTSTTLGGGKPLIQRLGDLRKGRRSTWKRIKRSNVNPTLKHVTPGDIAMAYPYRIIKNIIEGLEMLDNVVPGVASDSTLLYAPEIKLYAMRVMTDSKMRTKIEGLYAVGDGAGVSRGIVGAAVTGIIAARSIIAET